MNAEHELNFLLNEMSLDFTTTGEMTDYLFEIANKSHPNSYERRMLNCLDRMGLLEIINEGLSSDDEIEEYTKIYISRILH